MLVVWVITLFISSFRVTSSCDGPCLSNRGIWSSNPINRAGPLSSSFRYRDLISMLGSWSGGKFRYCWGSNSSSSLLIDMRVCSLTIFAK